MTHSDFIWQAIREEVSHAAQAEPALASFYHATVLNHRNLGAATSFHLANKLDSETVPAMLIREVFESAMADDPGILSALRLDLQAHKERDPACDEFSMPFLNFKGFHALQSHRVAHWLWSNGRRGLALFFQNQISEKFDVDIHPGACMGSGIMIDHATGVVIGETSVVGNNVSILHSVTLGGSGCSGGDRHPKIADGVLISVGAKVLGDVHVGEGARIAAGSLVLDSVPAHTTVAGVPARPVGKATTGSSALDMEQKL